MIDNKEIERILSKLENMEDEELAVALLAEFNRSSSELGRLLLNLDKTLSNEEWKNRCEKAREEVDAIVKKINRY